jgi:ABC-2 type transport system permease protein
MRRRLSNVRLFMMWTAQHVRQTLRNPQATFFTIVFPLLLLVLFSAPNHSSKVAIDGGEIAFAQFFTPSIATFATMTSCLTGLVVGLAMERDAGILKRLRGTPLRPSIYVAARITDRLIWAGAAVVVMFSVGMLAFGVHLYPRLIPAAVATFVVGAAAFCALGMAIGTLVPNGQTAVPIVNLIVLPMLFASGVFSPLTGAPTWLRDVANILPLRHMVQAFGGAFSPYTAGWGFAWGDLAALLAWGAAGTLIAVRRFRWEPSQATAGWKRNWRRRTASLQS